MRLAVSIACFLSLTACGSDDATGPAPNEIPPCEPRALGPDPDFAASRDPGSDNIILAQAIAQRYMAGHPPEDALWDWGESVLMLSLVDLYRVTGDTALRDYYRAWIDYYRSVGYRHLITSSDRCPPAMSALALYTETCELGYREVVTDTLSYLYDEALRDADGGLNHLGTNDIFGVSLWLDSLFMFGGILTRWGAYDDDARALDEYAAQFALFVTRLQDDGGFMMHAHNWPVSMQDDGIYWARGNAWVTAAGYEYLSVRNRRGESDATVEQALAKQVDAIIASQEPSDGLWWTVLNRPGDSYTETSASALFALGLARGHRAGFVDATALPTIQSAMDGVRMRIVDNGDGPTITGTSGPTTVGSFDDYAGIGVEDDIHYGVGAVILALVETSGL